MGSFIKRYGPFGPYRLIMNFCGALGFDNLAILSGAIWNFLLWPQYFCFLTRKRLNLSRGSKRRSAQEIGAASKYSMFNFCVIVLNVVFAPR